LYKATITRSIINQYQISHSAQPTQPGPARHHNSHAKYKI